jgi:acetyl-CoA carboxylase biotin carboxylase subunit
LNKILVANRGEIAVRILRTCRDMGLASVAVYSAADRTALHVRLADEARSIGSDQASDSYLRIDRLIDAAKASGADAVHPGYGFLAENAAFARACRDAGVTFIGPTPEVIEVMGSKTGARQVAIQAGVPVVPGMEAPLDDAAPASMLVAAAATIGYPLLVKAVAGGGGKGMRVVRARAELADAVATARSEAQSAFGDGAVYFERLLERPRHIEVQLLGDTHGTVRAFVERECSIQRRHQKLIEESPSPSVSATLRRLLMEAAAAIGRAVGYTSAGTVEFLVDEQGKFYFLEMNTRLQVEHPVTEAVTGLDFVRAQIDIARGRPLDVGSAADEPSFAGHAIECRIYAEDPAEGFLPSPGTITHLRAPGGPGIRDDTGAFAGWSVSTSYDPLISKLVAWAPDRPGAVARMIRALSEYELRGVATTIGFCRWLMEMQAFQSGDFDTTTVDRLIERYRSGEDRPAAATVEAAAALEEIIAVAAALYAEHESNQPDVVRRHVTAQEGLWGRQARIEALREL